MCVRVCTVLRLITPNFQFSYCEINLVQKHFYFGTPKKRTNKLEKLTKKIIKHTHTHTRAASARSDGRIEEEEFSMVGDGFAAKWGEKGLEHFSRPPHI